MVELDHIILKVNELDNSVAFYTGVLGFEHYAFAVSRKEFDEIFSRGKQAGIDYGPSFDSVGANSGPGNESGARGEAPSVYFNDPNSHLIEIRTYD